jgi:hypothetical protein
LKIDGFVTETIFGQQSDAALTYNTPNPQT